MCDNNRVLKVHNNQQLDQTNTKENYIIPKKHFLERNNVNDKDLIKVLRKLPSFLDAEESIDKDESYKVILPVNIREQLADGSVSWNVDKSGMQLPTIKNEKGSFICQARLEEIKPSQLDVINNIAKKTTMANILEQLEQLNEQVSNVLQGQFSDRIGTVIAGEEIYKQALLTKDKGKKEQLLIQAITELNRGRSQLISSLENGAKLFEKLPKSEIKQIIYSVFQKIDTKKIERQFYETQDTFENIIEASYYLMLAYDELDEPLSLKESLIPLRECIKQYSDKIDLVSEFLPYNPELENENTWYKNPEKIISSFDAHIELLSSKYTGNIEFEVTGKQLLEGG